MGRASLTERTILAGRELSLGRRRSPLAILPFTGPTVAPKRRTLRMDLRTEPHIAAMTDTIESLQKPAPTHRRYVLAGLSILIAVSGGYVVPSRFVLEFDWRGLQ